MLTPSSLENEVHSADETVNISRRSALSALISATIGSAAVFRQKIASLLVDDNQGIPELSEMTILKQNGRSKLAEAAASLQSNIESDPTYLEKQRSALQHDIWRDGNILPVDLPVQITQNTKECDWPMPELRTYGVTHKISIKDKHPEFETPFTSHVYYYKPPADANSNRLMIVHQGHGGVAANLTDSIAMRLRNSGFHILYANMPLIGGNTGPTPPSAHQTHTTPGGVNSCCGHQNMGAFATDKINPLRYFFSHISTGIHHAKIINNQDFDDISMCGISGGGYTTTVYPALDPSIKHSFAIAGSMPHELRTSNEYAWEDDSGQSMFTHAPMYMMYALSSVGPKGGRTHRQMYNLNDGVFAAKDGRHNVYCPILKPVIESAGGDFDVVADLYANQHHITFAHQNSIVQTILSPNNIRAENK